MALTDTEIRRSKKKEKPYKLSDGGNLFLWVTPYCANYQFVDL